MCVCALFAINAPYFIYNKCTSYITLIPQHYNLTLFISS